MSELGEAIRRVRMGAGLQQKQVAELLGVDFTYISHLEAGRRTPSLEVLRGLAALPGCPRELVVRLAYATLGLTQ